MGSSGNGSSNNGGDKEKTAIELKYWQQVVEDVNASNDDLGLINESMIGLMDVVLVALPAVAIAREPGIYEFVEVVMNSVTAMQDPLIKIIERSNRTLELVEGRINMIREELR